LQRFFLVIVLFCVCLGSALPVAAQQYSNRIVAVVNGEIITLFELNKRLKPYLEQFRGRQLSPKEKEAVMDMKRKALDRMIDDVLLEQEVSDVDMDVSEADIENRIRDLRRKLDSQGQNLEDFMRLEGHDMDSLREQVRKEILKHKLIGFWVRRKVMVTEDEIRNYYERHKSDYIREKKVGLRIIIPDGSMSADHLKRRISGGELSFADAADIYSQGPGVGEGGYIGFLNWDELAPDWKAALEGLETGDISDPFTIQGKEALLQVVEIKAGDLKPLEDVRDDIRKTILEKKYSERLDQYLGQLRDKAVIDVKL
jgi:peptidyl-prolyl cis-trans isomerase SurA